MGCWSVYCGLSNITISAGQKAVLLALKKNETHDTYQHNLPYSLPIYGEYNDYGGIENIEKNFNTNLIEEVYDCSIEEFCENLTRRDIEILNKKLCSKIEDIDYMWIDREVYDYLSSPISKGYGGMGSFDMGSPKLLESLGFVYVGEGEDKRYKKIYEFEGKQIFSDGTWLNRCDPKNTSGVYNINDLKKLFPNIDISDIENLYKQNLYKLYDKQWRIENLGYIIGISSRDMFWFDERFSKLRELITPQAFEENENLKKQFKTYESYKGHIDSSNKYIQEVQDRYSGLSKKYLELMDDNDFCEELSKLCVLFNNMHSFSGMFNPYVLYQTPQCGEYETHQAILEKFVEINKKHIYIEEDAE